MMTVLEALAVTRNKNTNFDSFVKAVLVLYRNLEGNKVVYRDSDTGQRIHFELTEDEVEYLCWEMLSKGLDPYEEGLLER